MHAEENGAIDPKLPFTRELSCNAGHYIRTAFDRQERRITWWVSWQRP